MRPNTIVGSFKALSWITPGYFGFKSLNRTYQGSVFLYTLPQKAFFLVFYALHELQGQRAHAFEFEGILLKCFFHFKRLCSKSLK